MGAQGLKYLFYTAILVNRLMFQKNSHQFGVLSCHAVRILDQSLKLVVLSESDDLQHGTKF